MTLLVMSTVNVSIVLGIALTAAALLRRRSAALRHWIVTVAVGCAIAAPALEIARPALYASHSRWITEVIDPGVAARIETTADGPSAPGGARRGSSWLAAIGTAMGRPFLLAAAGVEALQGRWNLLLLAIWLAGASTALSVLFVRLSRLARLARVTERVQDPAWLHLVAETARMHRIRRPIVLLRSADPAMVVTWGAIRPRVLLPAAAHWSRERARIVLAHELAHVRRNDWAVQIAASALQAVYWFNPLVWIAARVLRREAERACDDVVPKAGVAGTDYATHLLAVARDTALTRRRWSAAAAIAQPSTLEGRIRAMLNVRMNREPLTGFARAASLLVSALIVVSAVGLSAAAAAQAGVSGFGAVLYDQTGGLLPSVAVSVTQTATGRTYQGSTDSAGAFAIRDVPAGVYEVELSLPGFAVVRATINVRPGEVLQRNVVLPLGSIEETLMIVGPASPGTASPGLSPQAVRPARQIPEPRIPNTAPGSIGGNIRMPRKLVSVNPIFPAELGGSSATVILSGRIGIDGFLVDLKDASKTEAHPLFVSALLAAAYQWEFTPTYLNGAPVEVNLTITGRFSSR